MFQRSVSLIEYLSEIHAFCRTLHASRFRVRLDDFIPRERIRDEFLTVLRFADEGDYELAAATASGIFEEFGEDNCQEWGHFVSACDLALRIDSFLASLENGPAGFLARGCRDDLQTLLVLADWCLENDFPAASEESRHLHSSLVLTGTPSSP